MTKKKDPKDYKKQGRPTRFSKKLLPIIQKLCKAGATDKEIAIVFNITEQTVNNWKKKHPDFFESLKDWKTEADGKMERSLFERGNGYSHPDIKVIFDKDGKVTLNEDGSILHDGRIIIVPLTKHYPPDTAAGIFWLKNRQPEKWRDKIVQEITGDLRVTSKALTDEEIREKLIDLGIDPDDLEDVSDESENLSDSDYDEEPQ